MKRLSSSHPTVLRQLERHLPRREFLAWSAALATLASCRHNPTHARPTSTELPELEGKGRKVIVLGAGIAGLAAAYNLDRLGFAVTVLEKTKRVSGRVWTDYDFFEDGQYCELGATRIPDCHDQTRKYAELMGLELVPLDHGSEDDTLYYLDGVRRYKKPGRDEAPWPEAREALESGYTGGVFSNIGDPSRPDWPFGPGQMAPEQVRQLDSLTFAAYLKSIGYTDFARKVVRSANGSEVDMYSALTWLAGEYLEQAWSRTYRIKGGNQQLAERLAAKLRSQGRLQLLADVRAVESAANGVKVTYRQRGETQTIAGDFIVCTLPLDVLKKIEWRPGLSPRKLAASKQVAMQAVTRVNVQFKERFWEQSPYDLKGLKILHSDLPIERLWDMTGSADQKLRAGKPSPKGILTAYLQHDLARRLGQKSPAERVETLLVQMERCFPGCRRHFIQGKGMSWLWHEQDWVGGGWSAYRPGQIDLYLATREPEGRVYFAGDHTSLEPGWIQGALDSAHRALTQLASDLEKGGEAAVPA